MKILKTMLEDIKSFPIVFVLIIAVLLGVISIAILLIVWLVSTVTGLSEEYSAIIVTSLLLIAAWVINAAER